jgi:hypothetical protein
MYTYANGDVQYYISKLHFYRSLNITGLREFQNADCFALINQTKQQAMLSYECSWIKKVNVRDSPPVVSAKPVWYVHEANGYGEHTAIAKNRSIAIV